MAWQERRTISLEVGWAFVQRGITKLQNILEGKPEQPFSSMEYMLLHGTIYHMCTQKPPHDYSSQLYSRHRESLHEYFRSTVLPSIREKHDEFMLRELVQRWKDRNVMIMWFTSIFRCLDLYHETWGSASSLEELGLKCFRELIYQEIKGQVKDAVIALIDKERKGEQIDRALLKNVLDIFVEIGSGQMDYYKNDFEHFLVKDTTEYYSVKAQSWILENPFPEYMVKAEECLKLAEQVGQYLQICSKQKLFEIAQNEFAQRATLLIKEQYGSSSFVRDFKVDDLSKMFRFFSKIPHGLEFISNIFKTHIINEGTALASQAEGSARDEKVFMWKIIELYGRCVSYVTDCFRGHKLFDTAVKEAFEVFFNNGALAAVQVLYCSPPSVTQF